jgi:hypothetical protein
VQPETASLNDAVERIAEPVIEATGACRHIMALHLDPRGSSKRGIIRCIVNRTGDVTIPGFIDTSRVNRVEMDSAYDATLGPELEIENDCAVVEDLPEYETSEFLGFEDPNVWCDVDTGTLHFYCTIPFLKHNSGDIMIYLGHAEGTDLDSLTMTAPVLEPELGSHHGAKEVVIVPPSRDGVRYNLVESNDIVEDTMYSVLRTAIAPDLGGPWEYGGIALHPNECDYEWCGGHVSPGPLLPRSFVDVGEDRRVGLLNGREADPRTAGIGGFGRFTVGLLIYDYQAGSVEWVSDEPLFDDPDAETITFASAVRPDGPDDVLVYAHVDDSYVRAYRVNADGLELFLP